MAKDLRTDVLVVGAGPAGSMTAKWAAKGGARVLMIEKRQEIGSPVRCGEGMSKDWLKEVGIRPGPWINLEVEGARIYSPSEQVLEINGAAPATRSATSSSATGSTRRSPSTRRTPAST